MNCSYGLLSKNSSIAGVEFRDLSLIRKSLPVIIAYFYYDLLRLGAQQQALDRVCKSLAQHQNNRLSKSGLLDWILPTNPITCWRSA
jgi:hypothetical protein